MRKCWFFRQQKKEKTIIIRKKKKTKKKEKKRKTVGLHNQFSVYAMYTQLCDSYHSHQIHLLSASNISQSYICFQPISSSTKTHTKSLIILSSIFKYEPPRWQERCLLMQFWAVVICTALAGNSHLIIAS